jgi:Icc-related predicted phosphoesterase
MKIALISDVHAEYYRNQPNWLPPLPENPDVLVLAGDLHVGKSLIQFVEQVSHALPNTQIVFIAGNHEFYRQYRLATLNAYRAAFAEHEKIHFLENNYVDIAGIRFIGATLWTGFPLHLPDYTQEKVMAYAKDSVSDFSLIAEDTAAIQTFTPEMAKTLFSESKTKIEQILAESDPSKCVVVTHFPPAKQLLHPKFSPDMASSYFTADCLDLIERHQPAYWFYGHNHWSTQTTIGKTQLVSNQFGYPNERWKMGGDFYPELLLTL